MSPEQKVEKCTQKITHWINIMEMMSVFQSNKYVLGQPISIDYILQMYVILVKHTDNEDHICLELLIIHKCLVEQEHWRVL